MKQWHDTRDLWQRMCDQGRMFSHSGEETIADNTSFDHLLITPAGHGVDLVDFLLEVNGAPFTLELYEAPTIQEGSNGTSAPLLNMNRTSGKTASSQLFHGPTVTSTGSTLLRHKRIPGAKQTGGIGESNKNAFLLAANTAYLFRATNKSGQSQLISYTMRICDAGAHRALTRRNP
jgi:hypothetical protein